MKVGLLEAKSSFLSYERSKKKFYYYPYYLYSNMIRIKSALKIEKIGIKVSSTFGKGLSILFNTALADLNSYDIIHSLDLNPFFPLRANNATIITTAHDFQFVLQSDLNLDVTHNLRNRVWIKAVIRLGLKSLLVSDYIIAVSSLTKKDAIKLGYPKEKIFVVNHGLTKSFTERKQSDNFKPKGFVVGYMGALRTRKNPGMLFDTFKHLARKDYSFHIWGKLGYERDKWLSIAKNDRRIKFMGFAPENKMVSIYDSFDVFAFPSFYEGFGIPIIEAQARGVPVITYKSARLPDEVRKYCLEAEGPEHMAQIIEDIRENGYNEERRRKAMEYARSFTWSKTAYETLAVYTKVGEEV